MDPRYRAHGVGYITPSYFGFTRRSDKQTLLGLPGAELQTSAVKFTHVESAQPGLNAARIAEELTAMRHGELDWNQYLPFAQFERFTYQPIIDEVVCKPIRSSVVHHYAYARYLVKK